MLFLNLSFFALPNSIMFWDQQLSFVYPSFFSFSSFLFPFAFFLCGKKEEGGGLGGGGEL